MELASVGDARLVELRLTVKSRSLVRVLAITQVLGFDILEMQRLAEWDTFLPLHTAEVISDGSVIASGQAKCLLSQGQLLFGGQGALSAERLKHSRIIVRVNYHSHVRVVLGRGPEQRGAANIDVLDRFGEGAVRPGNRLLKGVEVDYD